MTYFNTTALSGPELKQAIASAKSQDEQVLCIFRRHPHLSLGPSQVYALGIGEGLRWLLTSVRRSISNLTDENVLEKLDVKRMGAHGAREYLWRLRQPAVQAQSQAA